MSSYAERLDAFADGKRLARMSRPIRNRADVWCDACGSVQARVLFGVKDERSQRVYFVGEHCLQHLAEQGAVVRRFCKQSAEEAYAARFDRPDVSAPVTGLATENLPTPSNGASLATAETNELAAYLVIAAAGARPGSQARVVPLRLDERSLDSVLHLLRQWLGVGSGADATAAASELPDERAPDIAALGEVSTRPTNAAGAASNGSPTRPTPTRARAQRKQLVAPANEV